MIAMIAGCLVTAFGSAWFGSQEARQAHAAVIDLLKKRAGLDSRVSHREDEFTALSRNRVQLEATLSKLQAEQTSAANNVGLTSFTSVLAANPRIFALWVNSYRAGLSQRFGPFYQDLHLSRDQIEKFEDLMTSSAEDAADLRATVVSPGMTDSAPEISALQKWNDDQLRDAQITLLGEDGYQRLVQFNREQPVQAIANGVASFVALTPTPLTYSQSGQLMKILADADSQYQSGGPADADVTKIDWSQALAQAKGILTPSQFAALKIESEMARSAQLVDQFFQQP
jgi:hypothetical protein